MYERFATLLERELWNDVNAEQQRALRTAWAAAERAHMATRELERAFGGRGQPRAAQRAPCPVCHAPDACEHRS